MFSFGVCLPVENLHEVQLLYKKLFLLIYQCYYSNIKVGLLDVVFLLCF